MEPTNNPAYNTAGDYLTRLTLDMRVALQHATDADTRAYAFGLVHLVRDVSETLASGIWAGTDIAGERALRILLDRATHAPATVPDWLRTLAQISE